MAYDAHVVRLNRLQQFEGGFVSVNPNSKIPAAVDWAPATGGQALEVTRTTLRNAYTAGFVERSDPAEVRLFESGSIMLYLAEKHGRFIPTEVRSRAQSAIQTDGRTRAGGGRRAAGSGGIRSQEVMRQYGNAVPSQHRETTSHRHSPLRACRVPAHPPARRLPRCSPSPTSARNA